MKSPIVNFTWKMFDQRKYLYNVNSTNSVFTFSPVYTDDTLKILLATKASKATGPDQIPAEVE